MTQQEQQYIAEIQGTKGFQMLEYLIKQKIEVLNSVEDLDERSVDKAGIEALAKKKAVKLLKEFLQDMGFMSVVNKDNKRTYE